MPSEHEEAPVLVARKVPRGRRDWVARFRWVLALELAVLIGLHVWGAGGYIHLSPEAQRELDKFAWTRANLKFTGGIASLLLAVLILRSVLAFFFMPGSRIFYVATVAGILAISTFYPPAIEKIAVSIAGAIHWMLSGVIILLMFSPMLDARFMREKPREKVS